MNGNDDLQIPKQLWEYISEGQRSLILQGFYLLDDVKTHVPLHPITDYSFVVFPFAKAYEGFLKQLFLDLKLIKKWQYESDHFRIGKVLSPFLQKMLRGSSVYMKLTKLTGNNDIADQFWKVWKQGRNSVFHYYPHNLSAVSLSQAEEIIAAIISVMQKGVQLLEHKKQVFFAKKNYDTVES